MSVNAFISVCSSRFLLPGVCLAAWLALAASLGMQWSLGLVPCPMCIVQRYCLIALAVLTSAALLYKPHAALLWGALLSAIMGGFTAARQSLLQWNPPEFMSCGRDFYGMVEAFPLSKLIPEVFAGSGDCASSADNVLGVTLANASFVFFAVACVVTTTALLGRLHTKEKIG